MDGETGTPKMGPYDVSADQVQELEKRFTYHAPRADQTQRYELIRNTALQLATLIVANTPKSREQADALTNLDYVVMMANAAIARRE